MKNLIFENLNRLIVRDFWMVKIWPYFHKSIWIVIFVRFSNFCPKKYFLKVLNGASFLWTFVGFFLGLPNFKMTLIILNASFHIDLGRFVGDWICIIQILE
jgi:hypothetical protein